MRNKSRTNLLNFHLIACIITSSSEENGVSRNNWEPIPAQQDCLCTTTQLVKENDTYTSPSQQLHSHKTHWSGAQCKYHFPLVKPM